MAVGFVTTVEIDAPLDQVWPIIADVERWHEWTASITSVAWQDGGSMRPGAVAAVRQPKLPVAKWTVTEVVDQGAERRSFTWTSGAPGFRSTGIHEVVARPGGNSTATVGIRTTGIIGALMWPMFKGLTKKYVTMEGEGLKARAEGSR
ncbi:MAG: SRPBCC family protein [Chloroflexi bacterium]|nr:SRPBCC family protein [Chloroflexota bacterium]MDA1239524.1 SRPBCC family protein [Chloroflexota bacterium]